MFFPHLRLSKAEPMSVLEIKDRQLLGPWWSRLLSFDFPSYVPLTPDNLWSEVMQSTLQCVPAISV